MHMYTRNWYCVLSHVQLFDLVDHSPPGSSVHGISKARILEWVAISFSRGSSQSRDQIFISCVGRWILYHWATWESPSHVTNQLYFNKNITDTYVSEFHSVLWDRDSITKSCYCSLSSAKVTISNPGVGKYGVFVNKLLLEHSHSILCINDLWLLFETELNWDRGPQAHRHLAV